MKMSGSEQCIPFDYYFKGKESRERYHSSGEEEVLEEACVETDLAIAGPIDEDQEQTEFEDVLDRLKSAAEEGFGAGIASGEPAVAEDFDEDHVTCYLREVAGYPLLSQEREIALAQTIRRGQEQLVQLIEEFASRDELIRELRNKVKKLVTHEKTFPGVRDKILKVILRTLERGVQEHPGHVVVRAVIGSYQRNNECHRRCQTGDGEGQSAPCPEHCQTLPRPRNEF